MAPAPKLRMPCIYYATQDDQTTFGEGPHAAIISKVHPNGQVNLSIFTPEGGSYARQNVSAGSPAEPGSWGGPLVS